MITHRDNAVDGPQELGLTGLKMARLVTVIAATLALQVIFVASAHADGYSITAGGPQLCALGNFIANVPGFITDCDNNGNVDVTAPPGGSARDDRQLWEIDSPNPALSITGAQFSEIEAEDINNGQPGYGGGVYWSGGGQALDTDGGDEDLSFGSGSMGPAFSSPYVGLQIVCTDAGGCGGQGTQTGAQIGSSGFVVLAVQENQAPGLIAIGTNNLFYQTSNWVWNAPGDPWPASIYGTDPSGVCHMSVTVDGTDPQQAAAQVNPAVWQQCPSPNTDPAIVDTTNFVPTSGQISLTLSDTNAAGVSTAPTEPLNVDNVAPTVSIAPQNDSDPGGWSVNHSVALDISYATGPSGSSSFECTDTVGGITRSLLSASAPNALNDDVVALDGNGSHTVACTVANGAVNPQGAHNTGTAAETVDIDEQPPSLSFEPVDPSNPDQVVVQTSDNESPVSSGSIQITPQGSRSPTALATSFNSDGQLTATIPDSTLKAGAYTLQASATSQVGNTGTISEPVTLPLRAASQSAVSFAKIVDPRIAKRVKERVRVDFHYKTERKHGKILRVKLGGHYKTITVIRRVEHCTVKRVKVARHRWKLKRTCRAPHVSYLRKTAIRHGTRTAIYGELETSQNVPLPGDSVTILSAPNNGRAHYTAVGSATTNATGGWKFTLPAGPSRIVKATYGGSSVLLPDSSIARLYVPARIMIAATPTKLPWSGTTTIHGRLAGGYIPADGVAMRLLIKIPGRKQLYSPVPFRTTKTGSFRVRWTWGSGSGAVTYPFSVATTSNESDYPYTAATSKSVRIEFGVATPARSRHGHQLFKRQR